MGQPIIHLEIMGKEATRLQNFYRDLFSWDLGEQTGPEMGFYAMADAASSGVAVGIGQQPDGGVRATVYVQVPDLKASLDKAVSMGGKVVMEPTEIPGVVTLAQFADPDGNIIGLIKG